VEGTTVEATRSRKPLGAKILVAVGALGLVAGSLSAKDVPSVSGEYAEARTCDVWTGPCFANGEMNLTGDRAILAWSIAEGELHGVERDGLRVVVSIDAEGTLGTDAEGKVRAVLYIDERASEPQATALGELVRSLAPRYMKNVIATHREEITFKRKGASVSVVVGKKPVVRVETKPLLAHCDTVCGNESMFYPALATVTGAECAKTVEHSYRGSDLGTRWSHPNARSAMIGRFEI